MNVICQRVAGLNRLAGLNFYIMVEQMRLICKLKSGRIFAFLLLAGSLFLGGCHHNHPVMGDRFFVNASDYDPPAPHPETEVINAFSPQKFEFMKQQLSGKKLALALITSYDKEQATEGLEKMFKSDFSDLQDYVLYTARPKNLEEIFNALRDYAVLKPIDGLILAYHGNQNGMSINSRQSINYSNVQKLFRKYSSVFSEDAVIILYSCSSGKGDTNIEKSIAAVLNRDTIAPKFSLIPETDIKSKDRVGEFAPDENGRLSFDFDHFRIYKRIEFKNSIHVNSIATFSYEKINGEKASGTNGKNYFTVVHKHM